jgi:GH15 family glucan-1,4-alpha-glucosidase
LPLRKVCGKIYALDSGCSLRALALRVVEKTLDAILKPPDKGGLVSNSLVYHYNPKEACDGLRGEEGTFNICTFWLVKALTLAGHVDRARLELSTSGGSTHWQP